MKAPDFVTEASFILGVSARILADDPQARYGREVPQDRLDSAASWFIVKYDPGKPA